MKRTTRCKSCGGLVIDGQQKYHHLKKCELYKEEGVDHIRCQECGYRTGSLSLHLKLHEMTVGEYRTKYPGSSLVVRSVGEKRSSLKGRKIKDDKDKADAKRCSICGEWYSGREYKKHLKVCLSKHPNKYKEGHDYLSCPLCNDPVLDLSRHLRASHSWTKEQTIKASKKGTTMKAGIIEHRREKTCMKRLGATSPFGNEDIKKRINEVLQDRYGGNPFGNKDVQKKIKETNRKRYGVDYPMQNASIVRKQKESAQVGPSDIETFFEKATQSTIVYNGYGGRYIRCKKLVEKGGKLYEYLIPDFIIVDEKDVEMAQKMSKERKSLSVFPIRGVIELFGDYWHSENVVGLSKEDHVKQVQDAYESIDLSCLILWGSEIKDEWETTKSRVDSFIIGESIDSYEDDIGKSLSDPEYWRLLPIDDQASVVNSLIDKYTKIDFPFPNRYESERDLSKFIDWCSGTRRKPSRFGLDFCRYYMRAIIHSKVKGRLSLYEVWNKKDILEKSIRWQLENESGKHHIRRFLRAMCHTSGFRVVSNLNPSKTMMWLEKYAGDSIEQGGVFYDPCAGWGSRLLASHGLGMEYFALDANKELVNEYCHMIDDVGFNSHVMYGDSSSKEDIDSLLGDKKCDVIFTSIPFYDEEIYSNDENQSIVRYPSYDEWRQKFVGKLIENSISVMKENGSLILHVPQKLDIQGLIPQGWLVEDIFDYSEVGGKNYVERLLVFKKGIQEMEGRDYIVCKICGKRLSRIGTHSKNRHGITISEYKKKFPGVLTICENDSQRVAKENIENKGKKYKHRVKYRLPDGGVVYRRDAWERAWDGNGPGDSVIRLEKV